MPLASLWPLRRRANSVPGVRRRSPLGFAFALVVAVLVSHALPDRARAAEPGVVSDLNWGISSSDQDRAAAALADLGVRWTKLHVQWKNYEPSRAGSYSTWWLDHTDRAVRLAREAGSKVFLMVYDAPAWASGSSSRNTPLDPLDFSRFVGFLAERYKGQVAGYEIWNEQNTSRFWSSGPSPSAYVSLLKPAYTSIKSVDPSATVVFGGLSTNDYTFVESAYAAGAKSSFDAMAVHPYTYCGTRSPDEVKYASNGRITRDSFPGYREVRQSMLAAGDDKPIWITEFGWTTTTTTCDPAGGVWQGGVSEATQADFLAKSLQLVEQDPYVQVMTWYTVRNNYWSNDADTPEAQFGLMRTDFSAKPAYDALKNYTGAALGYRSSSSSIVTWNTQWAVNRPAGVEEGDLLLACVSTRKRVPASAPAGWTLVREDASPVGVGVAAAQRIYVKQAGASEPSSYVFTAPGPVSGATVVAAYTGVDPVSPVAGSSGEYRFQPGSAYARAPGLTVGEQGVLLVGCYGHNGRRGAFPPTDASERADRWSSVYSTLWLGLELSDEELAGTGSPGESGSPGSPGSPGEPIVTGERAALDEALTSYVYTIGQLVALRPSHEATAPSIPGGAVYGSSWTCSGPVNLDLVKVYNPGGNAITIQEGCRGRIGRIEVDTWTADGMRITRAAAGPLEIGGGYIRCHARSGDVHQDGIQVFGSNVAMRDLTINCQTANNAALYLTGSSSGINCDGCTLQPANTTLNVESGTGPGNAVTSSFVCDGRTAAIRGGAYLSLAGTVTLPASDPRCASGI